MKTAVGIGIIMMAASMFALGCKSGGTRESPQGGVVAKDEGFSITVPASNTVKQGSMTTATVSLNRGADFKRDVQLDVASKGISVAPSTILLKAGDKPDFNFQILVAADAAIGEYRVSVKGTPTTGEPTSTEFLVKVIAQ